MTKIQTLPQQIIDENRIIFLFGAPGSGKTTLCNIHKQPDDEVFDVDIFCPHDARYFSYVQKGIHSLRHDLPPTIWVHAAGPTRKYREAWHNIARSVRAPFHQFILLPGLPVAQQRIRKRSPDAATATRHQAQAQQWYSLYQAPPPAQVAYTTVLMV